MKHWVLGPVGVALMLAVATAAAGPTPVVALSEPLGVAEPQLVLGRVDGGAAVAASDSGFMVVYRLFNAGVFGRLLDAEGVAVGPPFVINDETRNAVYVRVVFDGSQFVVAWLDYVEGEEQLWVQRVSTAGAKVGLLESSVVGETETLSTFDLARGASGIVAMACTSYAEAENFCRTWAVLDEGVTPADDLPIAGRTLGLDLEASGGELLAAFTTFAGDMTLLRVGEDGIVSEGLPATVANVGSGPGVVATEDGWAILWRGDQDTRLSALDFEGALTTAATPLLAANSPTGQRAYAVPNGFLVVTNEYVSSCGYCPDRILIRRFSPAWELVAEPIPVPENRFFLTAAPSVSGSRIATLWIENTGVVAMLHDPNDFVLADQPTPVSQVPSWQSGSRAAPGPGGWLVAWTEHPDVRAQLLDEEGVPKGETITLGSSAPDDFSMRVTDVSSHPDGWLIAWYGAHGLHVSLLDQAGEIQHEIGSLFGEYLQAVPAQGGWTVAFNHFEYGKGMAVATSQLGVDGSLSEPQIWSEFSANNERGAFDITPAGEGYRIWWASGGTVHAKDVVGDTVQDVALPVFQVADPRWLSAAQGSERAAVAWRSEDSSYLATSNSLTSFSPPYWYPTELTVIRDTPLVAWTHYEPAVYYGLTELHSTEDALEDIALNSVDNTREAGLSQARDNKVLLTFSRPQDYFGSSGDRVYATVATMSEVEAGGASPGPEGGTGAGGDAGIPMDGGAGTPMGGGGETAGSAPQASGGMGPAGEGGASGETTDSMPSRTSRGCGCRAVSRSRDNDAPYLMVLFALLTIRRRRAPTHLVAQRNEKPAA